MRRPILALTLFAALTAIHTWPLVTDPVHLSRVDASDAELNMWIVSWVAHQVVADPLHLFNANIFHPERNTLLFSEPLVPLGLLAVPLRAAGASPSFTYNVLLLLGFILTAFRDVRVIYALTEDHYAGLLAGSLAAFNSHLSHRLPHIQAFYMAGIPLSLWALHRLFESKQLRHALALALFVAGTGWTSGYATVFTVFALGSAMAVRPTAWLGRQGQPVLWRLGLAATVAFVLLLPILWGTVQVRNEQGLARSLESVEQYSMRLSNYLVSTGTFHYNLWSWRFRTGPGGNFFPGVVSLGLAAFWLARRSAWRDRRTHLLMAVGIVAFVLALGTSTPVYAALYHLLPPLQSIRAVNRFGYVVLLAIAGLAALGLAALRARGPGRSWAAAAPALLIFVANAEAFMAPYPYVEFEGFSPVYRQLAADSEAVGVVAEFPFPPALGSRPASYELASTEHWRPLLSGYSGFRPGSFREAQRELQNFPDSRSLQLLHRRQVTHVVVHFGLYRGARAESIQRELDQLPQFRLLAEDEDQRKLYRFVPDGTPDPSAVAADGEPRRGGP